MENAHPNGISGLLLLLSLLAGCTSIEDIKLERKFGGPPFSSRSVAAKHESSQDLNLLGAVQIGSFTVYTESGREAATAIALSKGASLGADFVSVGITGKRKLTPWYVISNIHTTTYGQPGDVAGQSRVTTETGKLVARSATVYRCWLYRIGDTEEQRQTVRQKAFEHRLSGPVYFDAAGVQSYLVAGVGDPNGGIEKFLACLARSDGSNTSEDLIVRYEILQILLADQRADIPVALRGVAGVDSRTATLNVSMGHYQTHGLAVQSLRDELAFLVKTRSLLTQELRRLSSASALTQCEVANMYYDGKEVPRDYGQALTWYGEAAKKGHLGAHYMCGLIYYNGLGTPQDDATAFKWISEAARRGHPQAQNKIGQLYESGHGTPKNLEEAVLWYAKAAGQGNLAAKCNLARMHENGTGVTQDLQVAFTGYLEAATQGDPAGQYAVGRMHARGLGPNSNPRSAAGWYTKAATQGHMAAQYALGRSYLTGIGVPRDEAQAIKWIGKAATNGDEEAQVKLGRMYEEGDRVAQSYVSALRWYWEAAGKPGVGEAGKRLAALIGRANEGDVKLQYALGQVYLHGTGVKQDYVEANRWYEMAAKAGYAKAQTQYGVLFFDGIGVSQDYTKAMTWFRKAASLGDGAAQTRLATMYHEGRGTIQDPAKARKWYTLAARQGIAEAQYHFAYVCKTSKDNPNPVDAYLEWLKKAADQNYSKAQIQLGNMYYWGWDVPKDKFKAAMWYRMAAEQGHAEAQWKLGKMYRAGEGVPASLSETIKWYSRASDQGYYLASRAMGDMYGVGRGGYYGSWVNYDDRKWMYRFPSRDPAKAILWWKKAILQGDTSAKEELDAMVEELRAKADERSK